MPSGHGTSRAPLRQHSRILDRIYGQLDSESKRQRAVEFPGRVARLWLETPPTASTPRSRNRGFPLLLAERGGVQVAAQHFSRGRVRAGNSRRPGRLLSFRSGTTRSIPPAKGQDFARPHIVASRVRVIADRRAERDEYGRYQFGPLHVAFCESRFRGRASPPASFERGRREPHSVRIRCPREHSCDRQNGRDGHRLHDQPQRRRDQATSLSAISRPRTPNSKAVPTTGSACRWLRRERTFDTFRRRPFSEQSTESTLCRLRSEPAGYVACSPGSRS